MKTSSFLLAIDSGNTAIKWGLHDGDQWLAQGRVLQSERLTLKQAWEALPSPESVLISNVAGLQAADDLKALLEPWHVSPCWITAKASQCGVISHYAAPEQLGCDRWAALIAAWHKMQQACLVVDVGTALTIDALSCTGEFLGGIILPGPDVMQQMLMDRTGTLMPPVTCSFQDFPVNTDNALYSGMIQALAGAVERMHRLLVNHLKKRVPVAVIITGGNATLLDQHIHIPHQIADNLVLEGLVIIARSDKSGSTPNR